MTFLKHTLLMPIVLLCMISALICGCGESTGDTGGEPISDEELSFTPEYDCAVGCDVFSPSSTDSTGYEYARHAFGEANTNFVPIFDQTNIPQIDAGFSTYQEMYDFVNENAQCYQDTNGDCVRDSSGVMNLLAHRSYFLGAHTYILSENELQGFLGISFNGGECYKAFGMAFTADIQTVTVSEWPAEDIMQGVVIHELGHIRADLGHLCGDSNSFNHDSDNHDYPVSGHTCIMANYPHRKTKNNCVEAGDQHPLTWRSFCGKCKTNLKKVPW